MTAKPGLPPWGPHVRFRRVQTLVREGSPLVKLRNSALAPPQSCGCCGLPRSRRRRSGCWLSGARCGRWRCREVSLHRQAIAAPGGADPGGRMLACRKWGQRQTGCYYLSIPSGVLLLPANDLRFGAVPHLFAPHTRPPPRRRPRICEDGFRSDIDSRNPFLPVEHLTVRELRHTTEGANRVECSFSPDLRPAANGRPSFATPP